MGLFCLQISGTGEQNLMRPTGTRDGGYRRPSVDAVEHREMDWSVCVARARRVRASDGVASCYYAALFLPSDERSYFTGNCDIPAEPCSTARTVCPNDLLTVRERIWTL